MRLELTGRYVDITPTLHRLVEAKLSRLERLLHDSAVSAQAVLTREKQGRRADITLHARGEKFLHGVGRAGRMATDVTAAGGARARPRMPRILRTSQQPIKSMSVADAGRELKRRTTNVERRT